MISRPALVRFLAAAVLLPTLAGCAQLNRLNLRGDGFGDGTEHWADRLRPATPDEKVYGFSTRAQEIEHNLGVR